MNDLLNSPFVNKLLRFAMSKSGPWIAIGASWLAVHLVTWLGLPLFMSPDAIHQIQGGLEMGANTFAAALVAGLYGWVSNRMKRGVKTLQVIHNDVAVRNGLPQIEVTGIPGNNTIYAVAQTSNVPVSHAIARAAKL